jgi:hypothetical protein
MPLKTVLKIAAIAAVFVGGYWFGKASGVKAASNRVFELRVYTANPGKLDALNSRFGDHTVQLFKKHGMENVGYWVPTDDPKSKDMFVYMLAFPNRDAAKKSWEEFQKDPEWLKVKEESERGGALAAKVESTFLAPTDYSAIK